MWRQRAASSRGTVIVAGRSTRSLAGIGDIVAEGFTCATCGQFHEDLPMSYGAEAPLPWFHVAPEERKKRTELSSDQCTIDDEHFFILGRVEIPVRDSDEVFSWLAWASLSQANFERASELWDTEGRESEPPYFSWLSTSLPGYPETFLLKARVHTRPIGQRPYIELAATDHPLAIEQRDGITMQRVREIAEMVLHDNAR